jgi:aryl-alcohol dehydrogenase-like predicted oxidoreductase
MFRPMTEPDAIRLVHEAMDLGITMIDPSRYYTAPRNDLAKPLPRAAGIGGPSL